MIMSFLNTRRVIEVPCRIDVEQTNESFHAHVELDDDIELGPGDEVIVQGPPIELAYGESAVLERRATVIRANWLERQLAKWESWWEITELYDLSFTSRRNP